MIELKTRSPNECRWDCVSLGEVMLRFDPGTERIHTTRSFQVWEGGGEYNVARALRRCFRVRTAIVTALVDNPVGRLVEDLMLQGGVDLTHVRWVEHDGVGTATRNGIYFAERGFGVRGTSACSDRGNTAISQLRPGQIDWQHIFGREGARWFHTGGIFAGLSDHAPEVAREAMIAARQHGAIVSYDLNYRPSLWKTRGGRQAADEVNRLLAPFVDVMFGVLSCERKNSASLEDEPPETTTLSDGAFDVRAHACSVARLTSEFPNIKAIATTLRDAHTACRNDWGAICWTDGEAYTSAVYEDMEILDRIGGGDGFASGFIYGMLAGKGIEWATECGAAHGALSQTTPGDSSAVSRLEVERLMHGGGARPTR